MDTSANITDLSPLEQRRARLRAFADRVLEAVEALPMPKTAADSERTLRAITTADRMLVQLYKRITPLQQIDPATVSLSSYPSYAPRAPNPPEATPKTKAEIPFVYNFDDDGVDNAPEPEVQTTLDLEQRANDIFQAYLKAIAENPGEAAEQNPDHPPL